MRIENKTERLIAGAEAHLKNYIFGAPERELIADLIQALKDKDELINIAIWELKDGLVEREDTIRTLKKAVI